MSIEISDIYIYVRVVRVSCVPFSPYTKETPVGIIERAKRAHSLFMSIEISYIYVRVVRVSCVPFSP